MVDSVKSRQTEGYDFYDYAEVAFNPAGAVEVNYIVGTNQNLAIAGAWPSQTGLYPPNRGYLPFDAQNTMFYATQPCLIRLINNALAAQQAIGVLPAGLPVQIAVPANVWFTFPDKWFSLLVVGSGAAGGTLTIKASG